MISPLTPKAGSTVQFRGVPLTPPIDCADPASWIADRIYQMGADQELDACVQTLKDQGWHNVAADLRAARRPKRLSLKEQALRALGTPAKVGEARIIEHRDHELIRRALEALPDDTI